jgi:dTDP-4-amino-4,6-dideoxygalactose transaminase
MITDRIQLIPRYNWDYGVADLATASKAVFGPRRTANGALQEIFGAPPVFSTSGRASLFAILTALNLPKNSSIGVPLFCCPVVFDAIKQAGLRPEFLDIDLDDYCLSADDLDRKKKGLSAVVVVHMFGHPADMDGINAAAGDLPVIEDCAQSLFSTYKGRQTGFLSQVSFFSFRSGKYLSAGEGSAIFTRDPALFSALSSVAERFQAHSFLGELIRSGSTYIKSSLYKRPWYGLVGRPVGVRLDKKLNLTAKRGFELAQIAKSDLAVIEKKIGSFQAKCIQQRENAYYLLKRLVMGDVVLPLEKPDCWSNFYQFVLRFSSTEGRDSMADHLARSGVDTAKYLDEVMELARAEYGYREGCPNSESCSKRVLSIPNHYNLSLKDLDKIADCLNQGAKILG